MIQTLFGNQNIERILFFLFVNEKCYGVQLQTLLEVPLTPIQNALKRLEKKGVLQSSYEGKARMYRLNPSYPLREELETLLKKAYLLLPSEEKRKYCYIHKKDMGISQERHRKNDLFRFWERLLKVTSLSLKVKPVQEKERIGKAKVDISLTAPSVLLFEEKGHWYINQKADTGFRNTFRWSLDAKSSLITLDHLRYGAKRPVFLFHLTAVTSSRLESVGAHLCKEDTYLGNITWNSNQVLFHWKVIGPKKNDELIYDYR